MLLIETCESSLNGSQQETGEKYQIKWVGFNGEKGDGQGGN